MSGSPPERGVRPWLQRFLVRPLLDLVFPPHCVACNKAGAWLCASCLAEIVWLAPHRCPHCGYDTPRPGICPRCHPQASYLAGLYSLSAHRPPLREAVHALKYEGVRVLAEPLAQLLATHWQEQIPPGDVVVPVPLHPRRERQRGYNQARLLAAQFAAQRAIALQDGILARTRPTRAQVGLRAEERWANVEGAFAVRLDRGAALIGRHVLLIDDVCTTGATLEACAKALLAAGAHTVRALTITRAVNDMDGDLSTS